MKVNTEGNQRTLYLFVCIFLRWCCFAEATDGFPHRIPRIKEYAHFFNNVKNFLGRRGERLLIFMNCCNGCLGYDGSDGLPR